MRGVFKVGLIVLGLLLFALLCLWINQQEQAREQECVELGGTMVDGWCRR